MKDQLRNRIVNYEHWISSGCKGNPPNSVQKELFVVFEESPNAYVFYRNYLWLLLIEEDGEKDELSDFLEFLNYSKSNNRFNDIISSFESKTLSLFENKRMNLFGIASEISVQEFSQVSCFLYQSYYEIECILLLFASIAILNTSGIVNIELNNLRDKSGRLKKGVTIDFIKIKLKKHAKLLSLFNSAYNTKLRNMISHNDYRISGEFIENLNSEFKVSKSEFFKSLRNLQKLNNFLIYFYTSNGLEEDNFKDHGAISIGFGEDNNGCILYIFQLECFYNIDREKKWFNKVIFSIENNLLRTTLSTKTPMKGKYDKEMRVWLEKQKKKNKLRVVFQSIRPQMNVDDETLKIEHGNFAICNDHIEIECAYEIRNNLPHHFL